jgi:hypothetical protein
MQGYDTNTLHVFLLFSICTLILSSAPRLGRASASRIYLVASGHVSFNCRAALIVIDCAINTMVGTTTTTTHSVTPLKSNNANTLLFFGVVPDRSDLVY